MIFAEVVVNVPIGRAFARTRVGEVARPQPVMIKSLLPWDEAQATRETFVDADLDDLSGVAGTDAQNHVDDNANGASTNADDDAEEPAPFQLFTYHLPADIEAEIRPGHLVWVPFGKRTIQGIVVRLIAGTEIKTRAILRLAYPEPVLSSQQIELAAWIATDYVAPLAEAIRLLLPPGLLRKSPETIGVRPKRDWQITLADDPARVEAGLESLGHDRSAAARILAWFSTHAGESIAPDDLRTAAALKNDKAIQELVQLGWLTGEAELSLTLDAVQARRELETLRGVTRYREISDALIGLGGGPLWRDQLNASVEAPLPLLRNLANAGVIELTEKSRFRDPLQGRTYQRTRAPRLTADQASAWNFIKATAFSEESSASQRILLHGVTGSGKTEIYLRAIAETLKQGKQAIVLVPEIALTPQTVARFAGRFPGKVTVIHSAMSNGERYDVWRAVRAGEFDIVVGPRSALFAPMPRLGLILIDEEHESSYKQDSEAWGSLTVFYDARRVAQRLAELTDSVLIAGSATPSLEIYHAAMRGEVALVRMARRVEGHVQPPPDLDESLNEEGEASGAATLYAAMPPVEVVDMRQELRVGHRSIFSRSLQSELIATVESGEQAILFLNRRGTHTFIMCRDCGYVVECPNCEVPLVFHVHTNQLTCHHCGKSWPVPDTCPQCSSERIKFFGSGTEQIEQKVAEIVPRARILRWDADTTTRRGSHEAILQRFANHEADILVGTQMIAKGLDLPLVTLVGVVAADVGLHLPDFRAAERTFQLLTQVAGRAGRSRRGGRVVIQSYTPEHYAIQAAAQHDYEGFYNREILFREEQSYPPIQRMARLVLWEKDAGKAQRAAKSMARELKAAIAEMGMVERSHLIGPVPAFFARVNGFYRWQLLLLATDPAAIVRQLNIPFGWRVDIDPVSVL